ncbi:uncharacterized protein N7511_011371 [Penicillium nucicola]|uniref:uncharacterized protein n=1 Tax=Penicillium nucicola TaxID=1850975 RepID=UPI002545A61F|nr:uncharacterized protein N7511_011371 [Penicillium nucicola]KAJ5742639.1 hypothetical protein N7511_011371 [Penicillium nucicola]
MTSETTYLDHAGTTRYEKSLIESLSHDMRSTRRIEDVRLRALKFLNAHRDESDLVFVANATGAIKFVAESLQD